MHDAHFHLKNGLLPSPLLKKGIINTQNILEFQQAQSYRKDSLYVSFGLHPWEAYKEVEKFLSYFKACDVIGEIGMDCVWSKIPLAIQRTVFIAQLKIAHKLQKPIILHTKGCEQEIVEHIKQYPNTYLVHWYACEEYLKDYLTLDTYFSIGPGAGVESEVNECVKRIPLDRLLIESDGIDAIAWSNQQKVEEIHYLAAMQHIVEVIADLKQVSVDELIVQLRKNYECFTQKINATNR